MGSKSSSKSSANQQDRSQALTDDALGVSGDNSLAAKDQALIISATGDENAITVERVDVDLLEQGLEGLQELNAEALGLAGDVVTRNSNLVQDVTEAVAKNQEAIAGIVADERNGNNELTNVIYVTVITTLVGVIVTRFINYLSNKK
ncbi:MAG: hypothetical protein CML13_15995 [Puniceicoccaceae bacterium]|nr:hypothetical protein [Puniceicoccaceae bacterium]|tara:strand:+ start:10841 stop:11281 length:441 start_codon:yes stop_codon:yes gene_type:complete